MSAGQPNDERALLITTVRDLISKHAGPLAVRAAMESASGYDAALWGLLCEQVGVAALVVTEEYGGAGGELADAAAVIAELGRTLVPTPLLGTTLAELALLASDAPDPDTLERLVAGAVIGTVVFDPDYVLNGDCVVEGADVVIAVTEGRIERWTSFDSVPLPTMDPTRRLGRLHRTAGEPIGIDPGLADTAVVLLAAEQIGAATECLERTVAYTNERVQFGRPIGSFQALKHRMADLYVTVQAAGALVDEAVREPSPANAAVAHVAATEAFRDIAAEAIQLHGGIAITWEHDIQLYFKRAHGSSQLLGPPRDYLRRLESEVF
jgi:alkylation response protein AidB-like acyl-CoA dehydrogenase